MKTLFKQNHISTAHNSSFIPRQTKKRCFSSNYVKLGLVIMAESSLKQPVGIMSLVSLQKSTRRSDATCCEQPSVQKLYTLYLSPVFRMAAVTAAVLAPAGPNR